MTAPNAPMSADVLAVTISVGRQEVQKTHPALPTFYQTRINFGGPENPGNTVALVFGNNSTSASEQLAFAEKLVRCYNQDVAVAAMAEREAALVEGMRELLAERNHRTDGDPLELLKRCRHMSRGDRDALLMLGNLADEYRTRRDALFKEVEALLAVPEKIAKGWDGCYYDDDLSETSIGDRIRHDASRLIDAARAEARDV